MKNEKTAKITSIEDKIATIHNYVMHVEKKTNILCVFV
jgi:hypothetical protein